MSSLEKFLSKIITLQLFINIALAKIIDIVIFKLVLPYVANLVNMDYFQYSRELIISAAVILLAFFLKD
jgi:hypothetical protein